MNMKETRVSEATTRMNRLIDQISDTGLYDTRLYNQTYKRLSKLKKRYPDDPDLWLHFDVLDLMREEKSLTKQ